MDKNDGLHAFLDVRGWGRIQNLHKEKGGSINMEAASKFQDEVGQWITDAINEKLEREKSKNQ